MIQFDPLIAIVHANVSWYHLFVM